MKSGNQKKLFIVKSVTAVDFKNKVILLRVYEAVYNKTSGHSLLSKVQISQVTHQLCAKSKRLKNSGKQIYQPNENTTIQLKMRQCLMTFKHRVFTEEKMNEITPIDITVDEIWD